MHSAVAVRARVALLVGLALLVGWQAGATQPVAAGKEVLYAWVELGPAGRVFVRAVTIAPACPSMTAGGAERAMAQRGAPSGDFPIRVCEARADPPLAGEVRVGEHALRLPRPNPERIVVLGDTGCRMRESQSGGNFQACNDPAAWPFARLAGLAAVESPDLVIHVGDYHYREAPCPAGNAGCAGSPTGDTWASWQADFFAPAGPLLGAAPWVFVRGNHEDCARAGGGWLLLLDPYPYTGACQDYTPPYAVPLGDLQLLMLDSSSVDDFMLMPDQVAQYRAQFQTLAEAARGNAWLLTHDPLWVFGHAGTQDGMEQLFRDNENLQAAARGLLPDGLRLVVSGHIHSFQALEFGPERPAQLVVGTSGTALDPPIATPLTGLEIDGMRVAAGFGIQQQFGSMVVERAGDGWRGMMRGTRGEELAVCEANGRRLRCR